MSARTSIVNTLVDKFKTIDGTTPYTSNLNGNVFPLMKFYDEINDFPSVYVVAGYENREYLPSDFRWGYLTISVKIYVNDDYSAQQLEDIIADLELCVAQNENLSYGIGAGQETAEILIQSIQTDEGVLHPLGVGEVNITARYQVLSHIPG
jgi:hypothetical protein